MKFWCTIKSDLGEVYCILRGTTWAMWSHLCSMGKFQHEDISIKSNPKQSESTQNSRIWQPLAFAEMIGKVLKSSTNLVLQKGDHVSRLVSPFFCVKFWHVDISWKLTTKHLESTPNDKIWEPLVIVDKIWEVLKSCRYLVLQRGGTTWLAWSPLCYGVEFQHVDIFCKSSAKQSESTANSRIWQPLALVCMIREVPKSCRNVLLQRGHHMSHVVPSLND